MGVEGAYFFNKYIGCGGLATVSNIPVSLNNRPDVSLEAIDESRVMAGAYFSYPFTRRWSLGCKALAGYSYILERNFGARLFCDYSSTSTSLGLSPSTELGIMDISSKNRTIHALTWGATASILF